MASSVLTGLIREPGIRVLLAEVTEVAQKAQQSHGLFPGASVMLAQGLAAGALLAALQKENQPVNLQLECDGPLRGLFVDAQPDGSLRGYVKNRYVEFEGGAGAYRFRPILGNKGYLSVLRDFGNGEFYRSSVELSHFDLSADLQAFFAQSEQTVTEVGLGVLAGADGQLLAAVGVVLQALPGVDAASVETLSQRMLKGGALERGLKEGRSSGEYAESWFSGDGLTVMKTVELAYRCRCSHEKVMGALRMLGVSELTDILVKEGQAEATCHFCGRKFVAHREELQALVSMLQARGPN
jgi:molecular chaperone Hsp33